MPHKSFYSFGAQAVKSKINDCIFQMAHQQQCNPAEAGFPIREQAKGTAYWIMKKASAS